MSDEAFDDERVGRPGFPLTRESRVAPEYPLAPIVPTLTFAFSFLSRDFYYPHLNSHCTSPIASKLVSVFVPPASRCKCISLFYSVTFSVCSFFIQSRPPYYNFVIPPNQLIDRSILTSGTPHNDHHFFLPTFIHANQRVCSNRRREGRACSV